VSTETEIKDMITAQVAKDMDAQYENLGWDKESVLLLVWVEPLTEQVCAAQTILAPGWYTCVEKANNTADALNLMVWLYQQVTNEMADAVNLRDVYAVMLVTEAWLMKYEKDDPDGEIGEDGWPKVRPADHPARIETRLVTYATRAGTGATLFHPRGGEVEVKQDDVAVGNIPDLMRQLCDATIASHG
jgi:hypothetical protein